MTQEEANQAIETYADGDDAPETEIRDTDIVFDCPHCGHNLAIDYRGAGLQITCVNCGESVLVPIPDGMKIDDLDIEPGEILKQLFAARRHIQKYERRIEDLEQDLTRMTIRRDVLQARLDFLKGQLLELEAVNRKTSESMAKAETLRAGIVADLEADLADEVAYADEADGGEDGEASK